jgi:hypothetical protein
MERRPARLTRARPPPARRPVRLPRTARPITVARAEHARPRSSRTARRALLVGFAKVATVPTATAAIRPVPASANRATARRISSATETAATSTAATPRANARAITSVPATAAAAVSVCEALLTADRGLQARPITARALGQTAPVSMFCALEAIGMRNAEGRTCDTHCA